jgi:hypothetical protein
MSHAFRRAIEPLKGLFGMAKGSTFRIELGLSDVKVKRVEVDRFGDYHIGHPLKAGHLCATTISGFRSHNL